MIIILIVALTWASGVIFGYAMWHQPTAPPPPPDEDEWEPWKGNGQPPVGASRITVLGKPEASDPGWMVRKDRQKVDA